MAAATEGVEWSRSRMRRAIMGGSRLTDQTLYRSRLRRRLAKHIAARPDTCGHEVWADELQYFRHVGAAQPSQYGLPGHREAPYVRRQRSPIRPLDGYLYEQAGAKQDEPAPAARGRRVVVCTEDVRAQAGAMGRLQE